MCASHDEAPDGARKVFSTREHRGETRRGYVGYVEPGSGVVQIHSHRDKTHHPVEQRDLLGEEGWEALQALKAAAKAAGVSVRRMAAWLREHAPEVHDNAFAGRMGPDLETSDGSGPGPHDL